MQEKRLDTARKLVDVSKQLLEVMNRLSALTEELVTELEGHATVAINPVWTLVPPEARFIAKDANGKW